MRGSIATSAKSSAAKAASANQRSEINSSVIAAYRRGGSKRGMASARVATNAAAMKNQRDEISAWRAAA